jgi:uncharacterized SAM-binding protein YcdF (DUF218 family)
VAKQERAEDENPVPASSAVKRRRALGGFILGFLFWILTVQFFAGAIRHVADDFTYPLFGLFGAWLATTRFRRLPWIAAGAAIIAFLLIGYTPIVSWLTRGYVRVDALRKADAVVVLAADNDLNVRISERSQARLLHGYEVAQQKYAPVLVISRGGSEKSWMPAVRAQVEKLGLDVPLLETPKVANTHDEATAVADMAAKRGWREVILVTHPSHMRRSAATFEKAGLNIIASPCDEWRYNPDDLNNCSTRLTAFRDWIHEVAGSWLYRRRGWMD